MEEDRFDDLIPDINGDGEHDLIDMLIIDDILTEEEKEDEGYDEDTDDWRDEIIDDSDLDPYDFDTEEEYEEALEREYDDWGSDEDDPESDEWDL